MTTINLTKTNHQSYTHDGRTYIGQATLDLALATWEALIPNSMRDQETIFDGSSDVVYALAWLDDGTVRVTMLQFDEEADGYPIDGLPFFLDIDHDDPTPAEPTTQQFFVQITGATSEIYPADLRAGIHGSMFRDDTVVRIIKGATD